MSTAMNMIEAIAKAFDNLTPDQQAEVRQRLGGGNGGNGGPHLKLAPTKDVHIAQIESKIGIVSQNRGQNKVVFQVRVTPEQWPTTDPFGRPFPSLQEIAQLSRTNMWTWLTSTGYPKYRMGDVLTFFARPDAGVTGYGQPIGPMEWRFHNGLQGKAYGRVHKANEVVQFLRARGMDMKDIAEMWNNLKLPKPFPQYDAAKAEAPATTEDVAQEIPTVKTRRRKSQPQDQPAA